MPTTEVLDPGSEIVKVDREERAPRSSLDVFFRELRGSSVYFCPNPGNGGDSLLAIAAFRLFERLDIDYRLVEWDEDVDLAGQIVIYGGGGNLVGMYPQARSFLERHHGKAARLIVLPSTVRKNEDLLGALGSNVDVICRETYSYEHVRSAGGQAHAHLMDDIALTLDARRLVQETAPPLWRMAVGSALKEARGVHRRSDIRIRTVARCLKARAQSNGGWRRRAGRVLNAFRTDREQTGRLLPKDNVDISQIYALGTHSEPAARYASNRFLSHIDGFEIVRTDRLHVCIGAVLLGKQVEFFPNSYFKNEAVYEFSLRDHFQNVVWCGD